MRKVMLVLFMSMFMGITVYGSEVAGYDLLVNLLNNVNSFEMQEDLAFSSEDSLVNQGLEIINKIENGTALEEDYKQLNTILIELKKAHDLKVISRETLYGSSSSSNTELGKCYTCELDTYVAQYGMDAYCTYRVYYVCQECIK